MSSSSASSSRPKRAGIATRALRRADRDGVAAILAATGAFTDGEIEVALSLVDEHFAKPDSPDPYQFLIAESPGDGRLLGYVCFGSTPLTTGTYDLYWIAVDPALQGGGVGRRLVEELVARIVDQGARLLLIETSSRADYGKTRAFYERLGFTVEARIRDFYGIGDDRLIYSRRLGS